MEQDHQHDSGLTRRRLLQAAGTVGAAAAAGTLGGHAERAAASTAGSGRAVSPFTFENGSLPFSFVYGGEASSQLLASWPRRQTSRRTGARTERTITWTEPASAGTGRLRVECDIVEYPDFRDTREWTVWFSNVGAANSAQLQQVLALDTWVTRSASQQYLVHTGNGSTATPSDFGPSDLPVEPADSSRVFFAGHGRPTEGSLNPDSTSPVQGGGWPYFNVDLGDGHGFIVALGWAGQWGVQMRRENTPYGMHVLGGMSSLDASVWGEGQLEQQSLLDTYLQPGERIRTPLIVWQPWVAEDWIAAQNRWRQWMLAYSTPRINGVLPRTMSPTGIVCGYFPGYLDNEADELQFMDGYIANGTLAGQGGLSTHWWMDAGWYDTRIDGTGAEQDWSQVGTWEPSPLRFADGLSPVLSKAHANGLKSVIWHEPERTRTGSWLANNHPDWLLDVGAADLLFNLGNADAWNWAVEHFSTLIRQGGIDVFRNDYNISPLSYWNGADPVGRSGITQVKGVMGHLAFWDALRARFPGLLIDTCASGGRRLDVESLRRSVPLDRSDYEFEPVSQQSQTFGLASWLTFTGTGIYPDTAGTYGDPAYVVRSTFQPSLGQVIDPRSATDATWQFLKTMLAEWADSAPSMLGDYYPLTGYSLDPGVWMAMQFDLPEGEQGVVLAFRRPSSSDASMTLSLRGIDTRASASYQVHDYEADTDATVTGAALAQLTVSLDAGHGTSIHYRKVSR